MKSKEDLTDIIENLIAVKGQAEAVKFAALLRNLAYHKAAIGVIAGSVAEERRAHFLKLATDEVAELTSLLVLVVFGKEKADEAINVLRRLEERM